MLLASKLNKLRTIALGLVFLGIIVMYFGFLWPSCMVFFFIFGLVVMLSSFGIYFWAGMLLTEHHRCVKDIIQYCNDLCYHGRLRPKRKNPAPDNPQEVTLFRMTTHPLEFQMYYSL